VFFISGGDPSANSGIFRDILAARITSQRYVGVITALTYQSFSSIDGVMWLNLDVILKQMDTLLKEYVPSAIKFGLILNFSWIEIILERIKKHLTRTIPVVVDPVIRSSSGYLFHREVIGKPPFKYDPTYFDVYITPNIDEAQILANIDNPDMAASFLSNYYNVILKGGHAQGTTSCDKLFVKNEIKKIVNFNKVENPNVRGKGCLYASLIACYLSKGFDIGYAMENAEKTIYNILKNPNLLW